MVKSIERLFTLRLNELACLLTLGLLVSSSPAQPAPTAPSTPPAAVSNPTAAVPTPPAAAPASPSAVPLPAAAPTPAVPAGAGLNPVPEEFPKAESAPSLPQLDALLSRVAALRSRIAALSAAMFSSKLRIELRSEGEGVRVRALSVSLDGGVVYAAPAQASFERAEVVYEHAVAPGPHVIGIEVERHDSRHPQFSTWQVSRFVVVVPENRQLWTLVELEDESSMGEEFQEDESGQYDLRIRLEAEVSE